MQPVKSVSTWKHTSNKAKRNGNTLELKLIKSTQTRLVFFFNYFSSQEKQKEINDVDGNDDKIYEKKKKELKKTTNLTLKTNGKSIETVCGFYILWHFTERFY